MKKPTSVVRKKTKINGQVFLDIKEKKPKKENISFSESIYNLQLKLFNKEINPRHIKSSKKLNNLNLNNLNNEKSNNDNINSLNQKNSEEKEKFSKKGKKVPRYNSMKIKIENNLAQKYIILLIV